MANLHDAIFEIDLEAVASNYRLLCDLCTERTEVAAVLKSDAYGLGLVAVATRLEACGCRTFFVADIEEALLVRRALRHVTVIVLRDEIVNYPDIYRHEGLTPVVNSLQDMQSVKDHNLTMPIAVNVDTGFCRFGLSFEEVRNLFLCDVFRAYRPMLVFSHLGCQDEPAHPNNPLQLNRFCAISALIDPHTRSLCASAGVWLPQRYHYEMIRCGSALCGLNNARLTPSPLNSVVRLKARLVEIRYVEKGEAVGYAATFRTVRRTRLGILGIGYANGLPWSSASNLGARIGEFVANAVGRISMEYTTVDLTDVPEQIFHVGAWVELLNDDFTPDDLALVSEFNAQELLVRLGSGCLRRYQDNHFPALANSARHPIDQATQSGRGR